MITLRLISATYELYHAAPCDGGLSSMRKLATFGRLATLPKQSGKRKATPHHVPFHFFVNVN